VISLCPKSTFQQASEEWLHAMKALTCGIKAQMEVHEASVHGGVICCLLHGLGLSLCWKKRQGVPHGSIRHHRLHHLRCEHWHVYESCHTCPSQYVNACWTDIWLASAGGSYRKPLIGFICRVSFIGYHSYGITHRVSLLGYHHWWGIIIYRVLFIE